VGSISYNRRKKLLQREAFWIFEMKLLTPIGIKEKMDLAFFAKSPPVVKIQLLMLFILLCDVFNML